MVGLPGSGKSTFGKALADQLAVPFIDLDTVIVDTEKRSIPTIFSEQGEDYFRLAEQKALQQVIDSHHSFLLATGGGTPCFFDNMDKMLEAGKVLFLNVSLEEITQRVQAQKGTRPLIQQQSDSEVLENLNKLYKKRLPYYKKAHVVLNDDAIQVDIAIKRLFQ